jgi:hypothetical protein
MDRRVYGYNNNGPPQSSPNSQRPDRRHASPSGRTGYLSSSSDVETAPVIVSSEELPFPTTGAGPWGRVAPVVGGVESAECSPAGADMVSEERVAARQYGLGYHGRRVHGERDEQEPLAPGWVQRYLGGISEVSTSLWNRLRTSSKGYHDDRTDTIPGEYKHRRENRIGPSSSAVPKSAGVWNGAWDPDAPRKTHVEHEEVSEYALAGMDDYGMYVSKNNGGEYGRSDLKRGISTGAKAHDEPDIGEALNERYKKQLRTYDKDQYGVPLPSTARKFSVFASPYSISEVCTGLGVYLVNIRAAIFLTFMLCVLMIYPMVDNVKTQNYSSEYFLYTTPNAPSATCEKGYWSSVYTSWIIKTSIGGHCDYGPYTSVYGCSSKCVWNPMKLQTEECASVNYFETYESEKICNSHLPCVPGSTNASAPDGPCLCCELTVESPVAKNSSDIIILANNQERVSAGRFWVLFLTQIVFMGWLLVLVHFQVKLVQFNGNNVVGPSDFSVWISGIRPSSAMDVH